MIQQEHCLRCGSCYENCPVQAVVRQERDCLKTTEEKGRNIEAGSEYGGTGTERKTVKIN